VTLPGGVEDNGPSTSPALKKGLKDDEGNLEFRASEFLTLSVPPLHHAYKNSERSMKTIIEYAGRGSSLSMKN